ncbi:MAG: LamG-like jellyroll fold domain-containing protein [Verrucomicrobiota bacterium]
MAFTKCLSRLKICAPFVLASIFANALYSQLTLDLTSITTTTHGTITFDITIDESGSVSAQASATQTSDFISELNQILAGSVASGLGGSFSLTIRALASNGGNGNVRSSPNGLGASGGNGRRIDWADGGGAHETIIVEADLSTAVGVTGINWLGFTKNNANANAEVGVVDLDGGAEIIRSTGGASETVLFSDGPAGNFSLGEDQFGDIRFNQGVSSGGYSLGALSFDLTLVGVIDFTADKTDISGTEDVTFSWDIPTSPAFPSYQIISNNPNFNGGQPLDVTANTTNGVGSVTVSLTGQHQFTFVENAVADAGPLEILSKTGPGFPNVTQTPGTPLASWRTSTTHRDRNVLAGFHRGYLWIQSRPEDGGRNLIMVFDISNPSSPIEVHRLDLPSGGVRPEHMYFISDGDKFLAPVNARQFHDMSNMLDIQMLDDDPYTISRAGASGAEYVQLPLQFNGQYGYSGNDQPLVIRNILTDTTYAAVDPFTDFGFSGHPIVIGNLLLAVGSRNAPGVAAYDISDPYNPRLLSVITSDLDALDVGNSFVNEGGYEPAVWGSYIVYGNQDRNNPQIKVVDFSDPTNLRLVAHITDSSLLAARYHQFQDEYMFTGNVKVDMRDFSIVDRLISGSNSRNLSEYVLPIGNLVAIGEHNGGGRAYIVPHQAEPDNRAPYVTYHNPVANATEMHVLTRIGIVIPETLNNLTVNSNNVVVRPVNGSPISGTVSHNDKDIINFVHDQPLLDDTTYEVILTAGGIEDVAGNGIEDFGFVFSTGPSLSYSPYMRVPHTYGNGGIPGTGAAWQPVGQFRIEAENFNQGGQGAGYQDSDGINDGGSYRVSEGADIFTTTDTDGGHEVGNTETGEWLEYTIQISSADIYDISLRVANTSATPAQMRVSIGPDSDRLTDVAAPITVIGSSYQTEVLAEISLTEGLQILRIAFDSPGILLNWIGIVEAIPRLTTEQIHYDFEGDVSDLSGIGNNGTLVNFSGTPFTAEAAVDTQALTFDGVDDYVSIQNLGYSSSNLPGASVSCWIKTTDGSDQVIASFDRNEYWRLGVGGIAAGNGQIAWSVMTDQGQQDFGSHATINDGNWHHIVGVFDGSLQEMHIYVDGVLDGILSNVGALMGTGNPRFGFLGVGSESSSFNGTRGPLDYFNGSLDDFRLFDEALDQAQVESLYRQRGFNNDPVITDISVSDYPANTTSAVTITVTANDPDSDTLEYSFNPGDGSGFTAWQTSNVFTHTYANDARYGISFQVRDAFDGQSIETSSVTVMSTPPSAPFPTRSTPITGVSGSNRVMTVNPDNNTVSLIDTDTLSKDFEVPVSADPRAIAQAGTGEIWVTCFDADRLEVLSPIDGFLITSIALDYGAEPYGIAFTPDGNTGFVSLQGSGRLLKIDPVQRTVIDTLDIGSTPRAIAVSADGSRVFVTRFMSPQTHGEVYEVDVDTFTLTRTIQLAKDTSSDHSNGGRGVPNYLMGITITPDGSGAWVSSQKVNIDRGVFREGQALNHENTVRAIVSYIDLSTNTEDIPKRIDIDNSNMPMGITLSPLGDYMFVAMQANNMLQGIDPISGAVGARWTVGKAPQGVWYVSGNDRLVSKNFMDRTVTVSDAFDFLRSGSGLANLAVISTVNSEILESDVLLGKRIFYSAEDTRMALDGYQTCASCHQDGGTDNRIWDFTDRGEGLRNTTDLRARRGTGHGMIHWSANFDEIHDFEHDIRSFFLGEGFLTDAEFNTGTRNTTLGDPKAGVDEELDALAAYVTSLATVGRSPHRNADGSLTAEALQGRRLFEQLNCMSCHVGDDFTNSTGSSPNLINIGTIKASSGQRLNGPLSGIDTPTLRGLWRTAPYLHDGSAATILDVLTTQNPLDLHGVTSTLTSNEVDALVAYLEQIDDFGLSINPELDSGFTLLDDFENYSLGSNMLGQGGWNTNTTRAPITSALVATDPEDSLNQVMSFAEITANGNEAAIDNQIISVEDGTTATLFFRMHYTTSSGDPHTRMGVGVDDDGFSDTIDLQYRVRGGGDDGQMRTAGGDAQVRNLDRNVWFNVWWIIDNAAGVGLDTMQLYLQSNDDTDYPTPTLIKTITHGSPTTDIIDTVTFTKFNENGLLLIDDFYYDDSGINFNDPTGNYIPETNFAAASTVSSQQISLDWTGHPEAGIYYIEIADSPDGPWSPWRRLLGDRSSFVIDGLTPDSDFNFRISSLTEDGLLIERDLLQGITQEPYDDWAQAEALPAAVYDKLMDADGDGIRNIFERAYGTDPMVQDAHLSPNLIEDNGQMYMVYQVSSEATDLTLIPQVSYDLDLWEDGPDVVYDQLIEVNGTVEKRQASTADSSTNTLFLRIQIDSLY